MISNPIYLDVCALSRPFDDQKFLRVRLETEAVNMIMSKVRDKRYNLMTSPVHVKEIESIYDIVEKIQLETILKILGKPVNVDLVVTRIRSEELIKLGFGVADAAHLAFAEQCHSQFITCDDRLIKKYSRHVTKIWCGNPVAFCEKEQLR